VRTNSSETLLEQEWLQLTEKWETRQTTRNGASESIRIQIQQFQVAQETQLSRDCAIQIVLIKVQVPCNEEDVRT
jgi:hypothetical protein